MTTPPDNVIDAISSMGRALSGLSNNEEKKRALLGLAVALDIEIESSPRRRTSLGSDVAEIDEAQAQKGKRLSLVEYLNEVDPATNPQRLAAFAAYRSQYENQEYFSKQDLRACFATVKLSAPANFDRDYANAVKEGWIHDDGENSYLTQTGENAVKAGFGGRAKARGKSSGRRGRRRSTTPSSDQK